MFAAVCLCLLVWNLDRITVGAELRPPQDVDIVTLNTNYTLTWAWRSSPTDPLSVTFTTQYLSKYKLEYKKKRENWVKACEGMSERSCDLTDLGLLYLGKYIVRVRADLQRNNSYWVEKEFCPDKDAKLGPPSRVDLAPAGPDLDVVIFDPLSSNNTSMKEHIPKLYYKILYWEHSTSTQHLMINTSVNMVTLPNLKAWTHYCVSVQARSDFYNKSSSFSPPHCMETQGDTPWWLVFVYFLACLFLGFLVVLLLLCSVFWCYRNVKALFYPTNQLPAHFQECLFDSPGSDLPHLLNPDSDSELLFEHVLVCTLPTEEPTEDPTDDVIEDPAVPEPDCSERHSRQDSSSSGDSGVYSTSSSSNPQQPPTAIPHCLRDPFHPEETKLQDIWSLPLMGGRVCV